MAYTYAGLFHGDDGRLVVVVSGFKEEGGAVGAGGARDHERRFIGCCMM